MTKDEFFSILFIRFKDGFFYFQLWIKQLSGFEIRFEFFFDKDIIHHIGQFSVWERELELMAVSAKLSVES
ncbi:MULTISPECIES: hypothetical protein [Robertmurraya]|uniref:Uncharacterized protein n=1 Tax=Robertmurraya beringensis TaxID=641660 RepID=A0ABV6KQC5_9BACI